MGHLVQQSLGPIISALAPAELLQRQLMEPMISLMYQNNIFLESLSKGPRAGRVLTEDVAQPGAELR